MTPPPTHPSADQPLGTQPLGELLPCPFCGGKPYFRREVQEVTLCCNNTDCPVRVDASCHEADEAAAIAAWNRRAVVTAPTADVAWIAGMPFPITRRDDGWHIAGPTTAMAPPARCSTVPQGVTDEMVEAAVSVVSANFMRSWWDLDMQGRPEKQIFAYDRDYLDNALRHAIRAALLRSVEIVKDKPTKPPRAKRKP